MASGPGVLSRFHFPRYLLICSLLIGFATILLAASSRHPQLQTIIVNDNRTSAGRVVAGTLELHLEAREGLWYPENETGPNVSVYAFGEEDRAPQMPGPLIRVTEDTTVHISVRNRLDRAITIHGLHEHREDAESAVVLQPGEMREMTFAAGRPGTYTYWASAGLGVWRDRPFKDDSELGGVFVVDPREGSPPDRIFVLGTWRDQPLPTRSLDIATINGKSWPYTERLTYSAGETIHWRVLNISSVQHPMHLHGGYFQVLGTGDGEHDHMLPVGEARNAATELLPPGHSMYMKWTPDRSGRWLFHCHMLAHVTNDIMLFHQKSSGHGKQSSADHMNDMSGLVLGITVKPSATVRNTAQVVRRPRELTLLVGKRRGGGLGYALLDRKQPLESTFTAPGPPLVLTRGEPVEVRVTNRLQEPTSVHWHGIEVESYYDGVPGWGGTGKQVTPPIAPGKSFVAHFTPPRAGTFIYHTHLNDVAQMSSGLYGPLIVLPPGERFDPELDRIFVISHTGIRPEKGKILLNGADAPRAVKLKPDTTYRFRFINISPNTATDVLLTAGSETARWRHIAKDGADLPTNQALMTPAKVRIAPGETYDFEFRTEAVSIRLNLSIPILGQKMRQEFNISQPMAADRRR